VVSAAPRHRHAQQARHRPRLDATLARLTQEGVKVLSGARRAGGLRSAFAEAPDKMALELVEGHARKP
jgi:hypothetical protein